MTPLETYFVVTLDSIISFLGIVCFVTFIAAGAIVGNLYEDQVKNENKKRFTMFAKILAFMSLISALLMVFIPSSEQMEKILLLRQPNTNTNKMIYLPTATNWVHAINIEYTSNEEKGKQK